MFDSLMVAGWFFLEHPTNVDVWGGTDQTLDLYLFMAKNEDVSVGRMYIHM